MIIVIKTSESKKTKSKPKSPEHQNRQSGLKFIVNIQSIWKKRGLIDNIVNVNPHIVCGTETLLNSDYGNSECFPEKYTIYKNYST